MKKYYLLSLHFFFCLQLFGEKLIVVQPYTGIKQSYVNYVVRELEKVYSVVQVNPAVKMDNSLQNDARTRFRADLIIKDLSQNQKKGIIVGLTANDISTTYKGRADWGVMGLSTLNGNACVISTFRLKGNNVNEKFYKLAIHEIGHAEGLKHCLNQSCFMRDAKGKDHWNQLTDFCKSCKNHLRNHNWKLR